MASDILAMVEGDFLQLTSDFTCVKPHRVLATSWFEEENTTRDAESHGREADFPAEAMGKWSPWGHRLT